MKNSFPDEHAQKWVDEALNSLRQITPAPPPADLADAAIARYLNQRRAKAAGWQMWAAAACLVGLVALNVNLCMDYAGKSAKKGEMNHQPYDYFSFAQPVQW